MSESTGVLKPDGTEYVPELDDDCPHKNKQNVAGAGMVSELIVCVDCGKEL
jgi:hypothetical protein